MAVTKAGSPYRSTKTPTNQLAWFVFFSPKFVFLVNTVRYYLMNFKELGQFHLAQNTNIGMRLNNKVPFFKKKQQQTYLSFIIKSTSV